MKTLNSTQLAIVINALHIAITAYKAGAGRPSLGKIKMTVHILPATRQALGDKPGEVLDAHFGVSNAEVSDR